MSVNNPEISIIVPSYNVEEFIGNMLESVEQQTYNDFEVLVVNDGATDDTPEIVKGFCNRDDRFHLINKENGGVSSARNLGIEKAIGKYIVFYDADDYIPSNSLEKMHQSITDNVADLAIGRIRTYMMGDSFATEASKRLSLKNEISPWDIDIISNFSVVNKIFRKDVIEKHGLKFGDYKRVEDGIFLMNYLSLAKKIVGCNVDAYTYNRRPFWQEPSATQGITRAMLDEAERSYQAIRTIAQENIPDAKVLQTFLSALSARYISAVYLGNFYKLIWKSNDDIIDRLQELIDENRKNLINDEWEEICKQHSYIDLSSGLIDKEQLAEQPILTFALSNKIPNNRINDVVTSIYNQKFPVFEVIVQDEIAGYIEEKWHKQANFHIDKSDDWKAFKKTVIDTTKSKWICFLDEGIFPNESSIIRLYNKYLCKEQVEGVTCLLRDDEKYMPYRNQKKALDEGLKARLYQKYDNFSGNKVINVDALRNGNPKLTKEKRISFVLSSK